MGTVLLFVGIVLWELMQELFVGLDVLLQVVSPLFLYSSCFADFEVDFDFFYCKGSIHRKPWQQV